MAMSSLLRGCLIVAVGLAAGQPARAELQALYPVKLSAKSEGTIARAACIKPRGVAIEHSRAYRYTEHRGDAVTVDVICAPHKTTAEGQLREFATCTNASGKWRCRSDGVYLEVSADGRAATVPSTPQDARNAAILRFLLGVKAYDGRDLSRLIDGETCTVSSDLNDGWHVVCGIVNVNLVEDHDRSGASTYRLFGPVGIAVL